MWKLDSFYLNRLKLKGAISEHQGLTSRNLDKEGDETICIDTPNCPLFHPIESLEQRALLELRPIAEAWVNHAQRDKCVH